MCSISGLAQQACSSFQICSDGEESCLLLGHPEVPHGQEEVSNQPYYRKFIWLIKLEVKEEDLSDGDVWNGRREGAEERLVSLVICVTEEESMRLVLNKLILAHLTQRLVVSHHVVQSLLSGKKVVEESPQESGYFWA